MSSRKKRNHRLGAVLLAVLLTVGGLAVLTVGLCFMITERRIDPAMDEALFDGAGRDTVTRLYYDGEGGAPVEGLADYLAVEWSGQAISGGAICLHTPLSEMNPHLADAFIAIEDHRFYSHDGVDVRRTAMAALNTVFRFSSRFGGSTITQQLIKNIGGEKDISVRRKWREMVRALRMERKHTKEEILEAYLNIVPLSGGCVGVGAAARRYFNKTPGELTLEECAGLAAVTCAPAAYDPVSHPEAYRARRDLVLAQMLKYGMIGEEECRAAQAAEVRLSLTRIGGDAVHSWYTETVISDLLAALREEGYTEAAATALIYRGGLKIYTCADPTVQEALEEGFSDPALFGEGVSGAMTVLDPRTGALLGVVGGIGEKKGDRLRNDACDTLRPPGSALKPIALFAPALEKGLITEATVFDDLPKRVEGGQPWPRNASMGYAGLTNTLRAVAESRNTVAVELYEQLGAEHIYSVLTHRLGISTICRREERDGRVLTDLAPAPLALGQLSRGVSLRSLTAAYLPLADEGRMHASPSFWLVTDGSGSPLIETPREDSQAFSAATAAVMTHMLRAVVADGSASALRLDETVEVAGKTGTSGGAKDRWFIGYTPELLAGVWCGREDGGSVGVGVQLKAFDRVMTAIYQARAGKHGHFPRPSGLKEVTVCRDSGLLPSDCCHLDPRGDRAVTVLLPVGEIPTRTCDRHIYALYDIQEGGVVPPELVEEWESDERLTPIALLRLPARDLPQGVTVEDAAYGYFPLSDTLPTEDESKPYFAAALESGINIGIGEELPYNRLSPLCYRRVEEPDPRDEGEEEGLPQLFGSHRRKIRARRQRLLRHFYHN